MENNEANTTHDQRLLQAYRSAFKTLDRDNDNVITRLDIKTVLEKLNQQISDEELDELISTLANDQNSISFTEFVTMMKLKEYDFSNSNNYAAVFKLFDKNKDGFIDRLELQEVAEFLGEPLTNAQVEEIFSQAGADDKLSFKNVAQLFNATI